MEKIISRNPATNEVLQTLDQTPLEIIPQMIVNARKAQKAWGLLSPKKRTDIFYNAREYILNHMDEISNLICQENGKPKLEALVNDIIPALDLLSLYCKKAPKLLRDKPIPMKLMKHRKSYLQFWPVGVACIISPWNYPFSIPFGEIVLALLAGNAVIFKPSEVTPLIGLKILEIFENSGLPKDLLQLVIGDGLRGAALVKSGVNKVFFTGSVATGKKVMASAADTLLPVVLELGGKDPMIVLSDANLDFATSAALWGGFSNSGQACASVERILVHEKIHDAFVSQLKEKLLKLKTGGQDLGVITFEKQKEVYEKQLSELNEKNSKIVTGGKFDNTKTRLEPTIVTNPDSANPKDCILPLEATSIYNDETFGPVVAVTKFKTIQEAVEKANQNKYGLLASVITGDISLGEQVARQIESGSVLINEVLYTHGLGETPWGGVKDSGMGRVHSDMGFYEFVNTRHIHKPSWLPLKFKSLWWFPYTQHQQKMFIMLAELLFRRSPWKRLHALPFFLLELLQMLKKEKRL